MAAREHERLSGLYERGLVSVDEYEADLIKKHEHTRPVKEDDRTRHIDALDANTGVPVWRKPLDLTDVTLDDIANWLEQSRNLASPGRPKAGTDSAPAGLLGRGPSQGR